jgi:hypothetical protein
MVITVCSGLIVVLLAELFVPAALSIFSLRGEGGQRLTSVKSFLIEYTGKP